MPSYVYCSPGVDHAHGPSGRPGRDNDAAPLAQPRLEPTAGWRRAFPGEPRQLGELRRWIASLLPPQPPRDDVTSVADELASNAIRHTRSGQGGQFAVEITRHGPLVRVTVIDDGTPQEPMLIDDPHSEHGRGLVVVNAPAVRAGIHGDYQGRRIWADIGWDTTSPTPTTPEPSSARPEDAAIREGQTVLGRRFAGIPAWYGRTTHAWRALTRAGLVTPPSAAELAGLLSRLPEIRPSSVTPGQRRMPHGRAHRCA
jgi:serine/threonine-protein kinase RsbW